MELLLIVAAGLLLCLPAWKVGRTRHHWHGWDYASALGPVPFWFALLFMRIGHTSMSNLIELPVVALFVPLALTLKVFLIDQKVKDTRYSSIIVCALCFALPLALRLVMPNLPE